MKFRNKKYQEKKEPFEINSDDWDGFKLLVEKLLSTHPDWEEVKQEPESEVTIHKKPKPIYIPQVIMNVVNGSNKKQKALNQTFTLSELKKFEGTREEFINQKIK